MDPVSHFEIPVDDMQRAQKYYADAFGWQSSAPPGMEGEYEMAMTTETDGEMMPQRLGATNGAWYRREEPDAGTLLTIEVEAIDAALERITAAGGEVVIPRQPVLEYGFYARFRDSEGNLVSLWESVGE